MLTPILNPTLIIAFEDRLTAELISTFQTENLFSVLHLSENWGNVLNDLISYQPDFLLIDSFTFLNVGRDFADVIKEHKLLTRVIVYAKDPLFIKIRLGNSLSPFISIIHHGVTKDEFVMYLQLIFLGRVIRSSYSENEFQYNIGNNVNIIELNTSLLSEREVEVWILLLDGKSEYEIAGALYISVFTVRKHKSNIALKLGIKNKRRLTSFVLDYISGKVN